MRVENKINGMCFRIVRMLVSFYKKYKEKVLYLFFGGVSFVVNIVLFAICSRIWGLNELLANVISWIVTVVFAFVANRKWVFGITSNSAKKLIRQIMDFFGGRIITLAIEEGILLVFVTWLEFNSILIKVIALIAVIVLNYLISKFWVFIER